MFVIRQNEFAWFGGDQWIVGPRLTVNVGLRFDNDSITDSIHAAPRVA